MPQANLELRLKLISFIAESFSEQAKKKGLTNNIIQVAADSLYSEMDAIQVLCDLNNLQPEREQWFTDLEDETESFWLR